MATEDHDFEESIILISRKKIQMEQRKHRTCREIVYRRTIWCFELYAQELGSSTNAETLKSLFEDAYLKHDT
jgi:hypothetical protein